MSKNRFEQVDEPADDAATLTLRREDEKMFGVLSCPAAAAEGRLPRDFVSDEMPLKQALRAAINFANEWKVALVVSDPDGLWEPDWGELYREDDSEA